MTSEDGHEIVNAAVSTMLTLPEELQHVSQVHKDLTSELDQNMTVMKQAKEKEAEAMNLVEKLLENLTELNKKKLGLEDECKQMDSRMKGSRRKDMEDLLREITDLETKNKLKQIEMDAKESEMKEYLRRMEDYKRSVAKADNHQPTHAKVAALEAQVQQLKLHLDELRSKDPCLQKDEDVHTMVETEDDLKKCIEEQKRQIQEVKLRNEKLKQDIHILNKRNAAQRLRLKNQQKEVRSCNSQMERRIMQLEHSTDES